MANWHNKINKDYGTNLIKKGSDIPEPPRWSSGSFALDVELGGGLCIGLIHLITGMDSDGKSSIAQKAAGEFQKKYPHKEIFWVDAENIYNKAWSRTLGLEPGGREGGPPVTVMKPLYAEQAMDAINLAVENDVGLIVVDSIAALTPKAEAEADMEQQLPGLQARLNSKFLRMTQSALNEDIEEDDIPPSMILLQQIREQIGGYGNPEVLPGGRALKFYPSIRIRLRTGDLYPSSKSIKDEGVEPKAQQVKFHIEKNRTAPKGRRGHFWFYFDTLDENRPKGCYDTLEEIVRYGMKYDIIKNPAKGSYVLPDPDSGEEVKIRGSGKVAAYIRDNEKVWEWLEKKVMELVNGEEAKEILERERAADEEESELTAA